MSSSAFASGDAVVSNRQHDRLLEWGTTARPRPGQEISGDLAVVNVLPDGALVAAVDGLGHGREAARAAQIVRDVVQAFGDGHLASLARLCHEALVQTRGAAISLVYVSGSTSTITWLGIGSVEGRLVSGDRPLSRSKGTLGLARGLAGKRLPAVNVATLGVRRGDVVILATDGIGVSFADSLDVGGPPQQIADRIVAHHWKGSDDAVVVVCRYLGIRR
jgi:phosphoserine phosphatase RsbX